MLVLPSCPGNQIFLALVFLFHAGCFVQYCHSSRLLQTKYLICFTSSLSTPDIEMHTKRPYMQLNSSLHFRRLPLRVIQFLWPEEDVRFDCQLAWAWDVNKLYVSSPLIHASHNYGLHSVSHVKFARAHPSGWESGGRWDTFCSWLNNETGGGRQRLKGIPLQTLGL